MEPLQKANQRRFNALIQTLSPMILPANLSKIDVGKTFAGKIVLLLTCWAISKDLKASGLPKEDADYLEEMSLKCLHKSLIAGSISVWQIQFLIRVMPDLLKCKYPIIKEIRALLEGYLRQFIIYRRNQSDWREYKKLDFILQMIQIYDD